MASFARDRLEGDIGITRQEAPRHHRERSLWRALGQRPESGLARLDLRTGKTRSSSAACGGAAPEIASGVQNSLASQVRHFVLEWVNEPITLNGKDAALLKAGALTHFVTARWTIRAWWRDRQNRSRPRAACQVLAPHLHLHLSPRFSRPALGPGAGFFVAIMKRKGALQSADQMGTFPVAPAEVADKFPD